MPAVNKHRWMQAVSTDKRIGNTRFLLSVAVHHFVRNGDSVLYARQATIAERFSVSDRTVSEAIARGRQCGYLVSDGERKRGRGNREADRWRLEIPADSAGITAEIPVDSAGISGVNTRRTCREIPAKHAEKYPQTETRQPAETSPPTGLNTGLKKGDARARVRGAAPTPNANRLSDGSPEGQSTLLAGAAAATAAPPNAGNPGLEPSKRCRAHADWDTERRGQVPGCGQCAEAREAHRLWAAAYERWREDEREAIRADIHRCTECGPQGMTNDDAPVRCRSHRQMSDLAPPLPTKTRQEAQR